jgi:transposase
MKITYFIGIDISKDSFAFYISHQGSEFHQGEVKNTDQGAIEFLQIIRQQVAVTFDQIVFCMEHTGIYCLVLLNELHAAGAHICVENANRIKLSLGLTRGKSDLLDAKRIAEYASRFQDKLTFWKPKRKSIRQLQILSQLRSRMVGVKNQLLVPMVEAKGILEDEDLLLIEQPSQKIIDTINSKIESIDQQIKRIISGNQTLKLTG